MEKEFNIFIAIFEEAAQEPTSGIKPHVMEREGKIFWEDNKKWQKNENLTPRQLLSQIIEINKIHTHTGYESI